MDSRKSKILDEKGNLSYITRPLYYQKWTACRKNMLSQNMVDNPLSVAYVENYLDCMENFPDDVQRHISNYHELEVNYRNFIKDIQICQELIKKEKSDSAAIRKVLSRLEQDLISIQELGDEKVEVGQQMLDLIDNKYRLLEHDLRSYESSRDQENIEPKEKEVVVREPSVVPSSREEKERGSHSRESTGGGNGGGSSERGTKRPRRARGDTEGGADSATPEPPPGPGPRATATAKKVSSGGGGKKKKRKARATATPAPESPPPPEQIPHDIDEPTYCLCDQISYGEMILCDNDLCPIEWFHFVCVSLSSKPKGKWFCPKCRGDRPNVMKPKQQFLKELERYNKEREEKTT